MNIEQLERGNALKAVIDSLENNIKGCYEVLKAAHEIRIETHKAEEHRTIFLTGEKKDLVMNALIEHAERERDIQIKKFNEL